MLTYLCDRFDWGPDCTCCDLKSRLLNESSNVARPLCICLNTVIWDYNTSFRGSHDLLGTKGNDKWLLWQCKTAGLNELYIWSFQVGFSIDTIYIFIHTYLCVWVREREKVWFAVWEQAELLYVNVSLEHYCSLYVVLLRHSNHSFGIFLEVTPF